MENIYFKETIYFNERAIANAMSPEFEISFDKDTVFIAKIMLKKGSKLPTFRNRKDVLKFLETNTYVIGNKGRVSLELYANGVPVKYWCNIDGDRLKVAEFYPKPTGVFIKLSISSDFANISLENCKHF